MCVIALKESLLHSPILDPKQNNPRTFFPLSFPTLPEQYLCKHVCIRPQLSYRQTLAQTCAHQHTPGISLPGLKCIKASAQWLRGWTSAKPTRAHALNMSLSGVKLCTRCSRMLQSARSQLGLAGAELVAPHDLLEENTQSPAWCLQQTLCLMWVFPAVNYGVRLERSVSGKTPKVAHGKINIWFQPW